MAGDTGTNIARHEQHQARVNAERWAGGDLLELYASRELRPVESVVLARYREALQGRVLELGCGAGRVTGHLAEIAREVHGIDLSPAMVEYCRRAYPRAHFSVGDLRDLSRFESGSFAAVIAPFNVLDVLGDQARRATLGQIGALLAPGGLFVMSSHNRSYALRRRTTLKLWARLALGSPRRPAASLRSLPRRLGNRRRLRRLERVEPAYAVLNDEAHDFSVLHYYTTRDAQQRQLEETGFRLLECLDLGGQPVAPGDPAAHCSELHYVARRAQGGERPEQPASAPAL